MTTLLEALAGLSDYIRCGSESSEQCPACARYDALQVEALNLIAERDRLREAVELCADYLGCIPESAAGGDDEARRLAKLARGALEGKP
jgi:hypothetical protein